MGASGSVFGAARAHEWGHRGELGAVLRALADRAPERVFVRFLEDDGLGEVALTYAELDRRARAVASQLKASGATRRPVLLLHPPGVEYVAALFGCFYAGTIAVPAPPPEPRRTLPRLRGLIESSQAAVALTTRALRDELEDQRRSAPELARITFLASEEAVVGPLHLARAASDAIAILQYTSGSTGSPRGVMLSHANLLSNVDALAERCAIAADGHMVSWLPPYHDMGLIGGILLPLCTGLGLTLMSPGAFNERPLRWLEAISRARATLSGAPNFAYELCARRLSAEQLASLDLRSWRVAFCGAERVRADTFRRFVEVTRVAGFDAAAFAPCYGLAEATLGVTFKPPQRPIAIDCVADLALAQSRAEPARPDERSRELVGCGTPLSGCEIVIVDPETSARLPERTVGEIWVRGPGVSSGYWSDPGGSARVFRARLDAAREGTTEYLRTGDLGYLRDGELFVSGRLKDLLILRGRNHYPEDIERTAEAAHPALRAGCGVALAIDDQRESEERLVILHEIDPREEPLGEDITRALEEAVAREHELAVRDVVLLAPGSLPKTPSGKLQRARSRQLYLEGRLRRLGRVVSPAEVAHEPDGELVARVGRSMGELLGIDAVAPEDDFFRLGGQSLQGTRLLARLSDELRVELTLAQLFDAPTPRRLAAAIERATEEPKKPRVGPSTGPDLGRGLAPTKAQERVLRAYRRDPRGTADNAALALRIDGPLAPHVLARALSELLERHPILQSRLAEERGAPVLVRDGARKLRVPIIDLAAHHDADQRALDAASELASAPFDLGRDLLIRATVYRVGELRHVLALSVHRLLADGWAVSVLLRDLLDLYGAAMRGAPVAPAAGAVSYADYAAFERERLTSDDLARALSYWKERLDGAEPPRLSTSRPRGRARSSAGALEPFGLPSELGERLRALGLRHRATPFMVALAAFQVVLHRHTGQTDLVVGVPVANRRDPSAERLVGPLANMVALRSDVAPDLPFTELLARVRTCTLEALAREEVPIELALEALARPRTSARDLLRVTLDYRNLPLPSVSGALRITPLMLPRGAAEAELGLVLHDTEAGRSASIEYSTELFDAVAIRRFAEHYVSVLESVAADPTQRVGEIPLLRASERAYVLTLAGEVARPAQPRPSVYARFLRQVSARPGVRAVSDARGMLTYAELRLRADALACRLQQAGVGPGERVVVFLERSKELVVALLAVLRVGAAYVPLDPHKLPARIERVLEDARPRAIVTDAEARARLPQPPPGAELLLLSPQLERGPTPPREQAEPPQSAAAYVIYTQGGSERPVGVEIARGALENLLTSMARVPGLSPSDRVLASTSVAFDAAQLELLLPMITGASVHVAPTIPTTPPSALLELVARVEPTLMQATPSNWRKLIDAGFRGSPKLTILCGGAPLSRELADQLLRRSCAVWNMYGASETTVWSLVHKVEPGTSVAIGQPIDNTRVYVRDALGALAPMGVPGELCIGGAGVATGYHEHPELTRTRLVPDPDSPMPDGRMYRTGDRGLLRFDGSFEHLGRLDERLEIGGFRVDPREIEQLMEEDPRVREARAVMREDPGREARLVAYYVADEPGSAMGLALRERLCARLADELVPVAFVGLVQLPRTGSGELDLAALPAPDVTHVALGKERTAPRDPLEVSLAAIWEGVLRTRAPGVRDSFFALGGDPRRAAELFARIAQEHGVDLPASTLFEAPTIEYLAARVRSAARAPHAARRAHLVAIRTAGARPPLFCVHGASGSALPFAALASELDGERPLYALEARGVDGRGEPLRHVEEAAATYLREVRAVQPRGPYHLAGLGLGGSIALEMARALRAAGEPVGLVALIGTVRPGLPGPSLRAARMVAAVSSDGARAVVRRAAEALRGKVRARRDHARIALEQLRGRPVPHVLRDAFVAEGLEASVARYRPRPYPGRVTLLVPSELSRALAHAGRELGWRGLASDVDVQEIEGAGVEALLEEPFVHALGTALRGCLARAEG